MSCKEVKLGDIVELITKGTTPTTIGGAFANKGIGFVRAQNIINGKISFEKDSLFIDAKTNLLLKRSQIKSGDVLIAIAGTIGRVGIVQDEFEMLNCNQAVAIIRVGEKIHNKFLMHWLNSQNAISQIKSVVVTGVISNLSLSQIANLKIPLPPLEEQKRIAAILEKANEIKAKRELALAKLDELEQNLYDELIQHSNKFGKEKLKKYLLKVNNCSPIKTYGDQEITYIDIGCIDNKLKKITNPKILDSANSPSRARQVLIKGDILVSTVRPNLNAVAQVEKDYLNLIGSTGFCVLRCGSNISDSFLFSVVKSKNFIKEMNKLATGASYPAVSDSIIMDYEIPVPPIDVQNDYAKKINSIKKITSHFISQIERMEKNISSLQNQAFTTGFNA